MMQEKSDAILSLEKNAKEKSDAYSSLYKFHY